MLFNKIFYVEKSVVMKISFYEYERSMKEECIPFSILALGFELSAKKIGLSVGGRRGGEMTESRRRGGDDTLSLYGEKERERNEGEGKKAP